MNIRNTSIFLVIYCLVGLSSSMFGQKDLYDLNHTKAFAKFLYQTQQYDLAAREFERLLILSPKEEVPIELFRSYRLGNLQSIGLKRMDSLYPNINNISLAVFMERSRIQLNLNEFDQLSRELPKIESLSSDDRLLVSGIIDVYQFKRKRTLPISDLEVAGDKTYSVKSFYTINSALNDYYNERWKKPWLASTLSAIIPGAGRWYAGDWKNAIVSLVFVGLNGYQSYRGFSRTGISSPTGWIFGAIGFGFYVGNIYGAAWTAKRKNEQKRKYYQERIDPYYFNHK